VDGQPDIRGWDVKDENGNLIGEIDELIFDVQSRKVRYMVVFLDEDYSGATARDVLVPIGLAELDRSDDDAILTGVNQQQITSLPTYDGEIKPDTETSIRNVFGGLGAAAGAAALTSHAGGTDDFYNHEHFNEDNLMKRRKGTGTEGTTSIPVIEENLQVGKQTVETGGAYIRSRIVETPVQQNISLSEEQVRVERSSVDRPANNAELEGFKEGVIELKEYAEVPVVSKSARVVEEVNIGKDVTEHEETVRDTVRKTEVDIEEIKKNQGTSQDTTGNI
jgi:uncharacterized protein (TIGR02271 family)